jgi:MFS transporter, DHA1 family, multidrug resistance protein
MPALGKWRRRDSSLFPVYLIGFLNNMGMAFLYPVIPPYAAHLGASVAQVGVVVGLLPYLSAAAHPAAGLLSDRIGRRRSLVVTTLLNLACNALYLFTSNIQILMMVRVMHGLTSGAFFPAAGALVVDMARPEKRGRALGYYSTASQLGNMAGPALGGFVLKYGGYQASFLTATFIVALAWVTVAFFLRAEPSGWKTAAEFRFTLRWLGARRSIMAQSAAVAVGVGLASFISFLPFYGFEIGLDVGRVGILISTIYLGSVLIRVVAGQASDKLGRVPVIFTGVSLGAIGIFLISILGRDMALYGGCFIFGVGLGSVLPTTAALNTDVAPVWMRGLAIGLGATFFYSGQAIGATLLGTVAASAGFANMYLTTAAFMALGSVTILLLNIRRKPPSCPASGREEGGPSDHRGMVSG